MASPRSLLAASLLVTAATARDVPSNVRDLYNSIVGQGQCNNVAAGGFYSQYGGSGSSTYCLDHKSDYNIVYIQGTNGDLVNMDIDCDGTQNGAGDDGRCQLSQDTQPITAFQGRVAGYNAGINDLNSYVHPYVVFGNSGSKPNWATYSPQSDGVEPLSVMAVVCGDQLIYGVWGDTNGDDGEYPVVGETSLALATACFGNSMNGDNGYGGNDVLYIAFPGGDAVPGAGGADWNAQSYDAFESSIESLGDQLIQRIGGSSGGDGGDDGGDGGNDCSWPGHCQGSSCSTYDDCSDNLICTNGKCSPP